MKQLKLAHNLALPIDAVTEKFAWLGRTGTGKTYGAMKLAELMLDAGAQIGALDPVGVWRALRVPAEKGGKAFDVVVFGGLYGDLPLEPTERAGHLVADLVCDRGISFVMDVSQFIPSEQQTFARAFAHRFFHRKKSSPSAVHLFMEECQEFIPENPSGREALTLGEFQRLWKLGRNFGIGGSLISQRPQEIAKKALNMSGTLFAFQMTGPQERKAVKAWVADQGVAIDIESVLQKLRTGEPHVESPTFLKVSGTVRILPRVTADLSSTPKVGSATVAKRPLTPIDVEQLKVSMADTIERAKQDDPKELRRQLADRDKRIREMDRAKGTADQAVRLAVEDGLKQGKPKPVLTEADWKRLDALWQRIHEMGMIVAETEDRLISRLSAYIDTARGATAVAVATAREDFDNVLDRKGFRDVLDKLGQAKAAMSARPAIQTPPRRTDPVAGFTGPAREPRRPPASGSENSSLDGAQRKILDTIAMLEARGLRPGREMVARWMGIHPNGGRYNTNLAYLRANDYLDGLKLTTSATPLVSTMDTGMSGVMVALDGSQQQILDVLQRVGHALSREELAQALGIHPNGGRYNTNLSRLRTMGLIPERGPIALTEAAHR